MGLRCRIKCGNCQRTVIIREGGFTKKTNKTKICPHCGYENSILKKKNGKILVV